MLAIKTDKVLEAEKQEVNSIGVLNLEVGTSYQFPNATLEWNSVLLLLAYILGLPTEGQAHAISPVHLLSPEELIAHILQQSLQDRLQEIVVEASKLRNRSTS